MSLSFSSIALAIEAEAKKVEKDLAPLWPQLAKLAEATAEQLAAASLKAMMAQAPAVVLGKEKLSDASAAVAVDLGNQGLMAAANLIETSVQLALNQVQSMRPAQ